MRQASTNTVQCIVVITSTPRNMFSACVGFPLLECQLSQTSENAAMRRCPPPPPLMFFQYHLTQPNSQKRPVRSGGFHGERKTETSPRLQCIQLFFSQTLFDFKRLVSHSISPKFSGKIPFVLSKPRIFFLGGVQR